MRSSSRGGRGGDHQSDSQERSVLQVDSSLIGRIIGPRGSTIQQLQNDNNVRINISKDNNADQTKDVEVLGNTKNDVFKTEEEIKKIVRRYSKYSDQPREQNQKKERFSQNSNRNQPAIIDESWDDDEYTMQPRPQKAKPTSSYQDDSRHKTYNQHHSAIPNQESWDDDFSTSQAPSRQHNSRDANKFLDQVNDSNNWDHIDNNQQDYVKPTKHYNDYNDNYGSSRGNSGAGYKRNNDGAFNRRDGNRRDDYRRDNNRRDNAYNFNSQISSFADPIPDDNTEIDWDKINEQCEIARKARWAKCPTLLKNFYTEHPEVTAQTNEEVEKFRLENNNIAVSRTFDENAKPEDLPKPCPKFEHCFSDYPDLMATIEKQGFKKPSPIQSQAWPVLLQGEDLIGIAQTGTGKTLAFLFPALIHIVNQPIPRGQRGGPNVLVLAPTRELAIQIEMEVAKYEFRDVNAVCLYGGGERHKQIEKVKAGVEIIIATPGRLNDLVAAKYIDIATITYLILDEADRMLDMGFEPQIRKLLLDIRPDRQTVMTSATWPNSVRRLAASYMNNPIQVYIGSLDLAATHTVTQLIEIMDEEDKYHRIFKFVTREMNETDKCIIFCGKKDRADDLSSEFSLKGIDCQSIHGNRDQSDREQALADIKSGEVRILVATDVASRGIDIEDITYVINYDFPRNIEEYVHRVGRTGRAGRRGVSLSFMTRVDWGSAKELISILEEANQEVPDKLRTMAEKFEAMKQRRNDEKAKFGMGGGRGSRGGGGGGGRNRW